MNTEWKVEWLDEEGRGHLTEFENEIQARKYIETIASMTMMADIYSRSTGPWQRNPRKTI